MRRASGSGEARRAVYQCGDKPDDDEIRNKRAGNAQQRRKDAQSVLAVPPFASSASHEAAERFCFVF